MSLIASNKYTVVIGLGATGLSAVRYLLAQGVQVIAMDSREAPPTLDAVKSEFPDLAIECGDLEQDTLLHAQEIIISPGISRKTPAIKAALDAKVSVIGDVELFARALASTTASVVAITGSNGKSTVTTLLGDMAKRCGLKTVVAGNIGKPVLDTLPDIAEFYVLELSSFQLESTQTLHPKVATILNVSADHMDRYASFMEYALTKQRIAFGAKHLVVNKDDVLTIPPMAEGVKATAFTSKIPDLKEYGVVGGSIVKGFKPIVEVDSLKIKGQHNLVNACAALALAEAADLPLEPSVDALKDFAGLPHRCEFVAESKRGITFINDSKATNVGAAVAALEGLAAKQPNLHIILGGDGKGSDFSPLLPALKACAQSVVTLGQDGPALFDLIQTKLPHLRVAQVADIDEAVAALFKQAEPGDIVLLSPACASIDMFKNFEARGESFVHAVHKNVSLEVEQ